GIQGRYPVTRLHTPKITLTIQIDIVAIPVFTIACRQHQLVTTVGGKVQVRPRIKIVLVDPGTRRIDRTRVNDPALRDVIKAPEQAILDDIPGPAGSQVETILIVEQVIEIIHVLGIHHRRTTYRTDILDQRCIDTRREHILTPGTGF